MVLHNTTSDPYPIVVWCHNETIYIAKHWHHTTVGIRGSIVQDPLALATRNLFHNFLLLRSLLPFKINIQYYPNYYGSCKVYDENFLNLSVRRLSLPPLPSEIYTVRYL